SGLPEHLCDDGHHRHVQAPGPRLDASDGPGPGDRGPESPGVPRPLAALGADGGPGPVPGRRPQPPADVGGLIVPVAARRVPALLLAALAVASVAVACSSGGPRTPSGPNDL